MANYSTLNSDQLSSTGSENGVILNLVKPSEFSIYFGVTVLLSFTGIITNALNIKTFLAMGTDDGVTVSLLALSLSDFGFSVSGSVHGLAYFSNKIAMASGVVFLVDTWVIIMFTVTIRYTFYAMTSLTTTFLAVARCMCVAKPLHFKNVFTRSRSIIVHICFAVIAVGGYIPIMTQMGAIKTFDARVNQTRYIAWLSDMREEIKDVVFLIFDVFLTFTTHVIIIVCAVIMANSLRTAGKFRQLTKSAALGSNIDNEEKQAFKLSGKELQVVQQVVLISTIYIVCGLLKVYASVYTLVEPEFDVGKGLNNFYLTIVINRKNVELINSATTFFVYYNYNSRFRSLCFRTCSGK